MTYLEYYKKTFYKKLADLLSAPTGHPIKSWELKNKILRCAGMNIEKNCSIGPGFDYLTGFENNIYLEEYAGAGNLLKIWAFNKVTIGAFTLIAADVTIVNGWHNKDTYEPTSAPLSIGRGCWIGNGARITGGVTVGNNAIVGAGAVVVSDIPENAVAAGVPAKIIGYRDLPEKVWYFGSIYFSPVTFKVISL